MISPCYAGCRSDPCPRSTEKDLDVKRNSLLIDRDRCLKARTMFPSTNLLCGYRNASTALNQL